MTLDGLQGLAGRFLGVCLLLSLPGCLSRMGGQRWGGWVRHLRILVVGGKETSWGDDRSRRGGNDSGSRKRR